MCVEQMSNLITIPFPLRADLLTAWTAYLRSPSTADEQLSEKLLPVVRLVARQYLSNRKQSLVHEGDVTSPIMEAFIVHKYLWQVRHEIASRNDPPDLQIISLACCAADKYLINLTHTNEKEMRRDLQALLASAGVTYPDRTALTVDALQDIAHCLQLNALRKAILIDIVCRGMTQQEFAKKHGLSQSAVCKAFRALRKDAFKQEALMREIAHSLKTVDRN